ncbi:hypothetical protein J14TS2_34240 [Bacillus sp. J14TS2]|uniref:DUF5946 family protein n=1 Tax=Bacillus sp. J14TS2 TaxID=2807188 RepID=UPI001B1E0A4C|nr:DUF5946 family protein [Bacillus sp. J14TS2]GIN72949.1 hypothetical protein J14TS2_34240 [Bacillus sp. J14TS2]
MREYCADCGAAHSEGRTCQSIYHEFMALEFSNPGYGRVHFLTVACYMIQHHGYSDEALVWVEAKLSAYFMNNLNGPEIRKLAAKDTDASIRKWEVKRLKDAPLLPKVSWSMTIADVDKQMYDSESYGELITEWGRRTWKEMTPLLKGKDS